MEIIYGKIKQDDGTLVEDKELMCRKFSEDIVKACFLCERKHTCSVKTLDECDFVRLKNVVLMSDNKKEVAWD